MYELYLFFTLCFQEEKSHFTGESVQQSRAVEERLEQEKQELRQQVDSLRKELETSGTEKASLMNQYSSLVDRHKGTEVQVTTLEGKHFDRNIVT